MTTIKDIAQLAEVSIATVSKIKNGNDRNISRATRDKVNRLIEENNYVPNAVAKGLKSKRTKTLGFILPDISNPFFPEIARGVEDIAWAHRFSVTFCNTDNDTQREEDALQLMQSKMVDGVIVTRSMFGKSSEILTKYNFPIVVVDRKGKTGREKVGEIVIDAKKAFFDVTEHLIACGCKNIAYISAKGKYDNERYNGFKSALIHAGLDLNEKSVYRAQYNVETGIEGVEKIFAQYVPDAIVCGNDLIAVGVMSALRDKQISVPENIKITGFDDIYFSRFLSPSLTTVKQPAYEMGAAAAQMLIDFIVTGKPLCMKKLDYQLIVRESTVLNSPKGGC